MALSARRGAGALAVLGLCSGVWLLAGPGGCAQPPTVEDRARRTWEAFCDRARVCSPSTFSAVFADYPSCVQKGVDGVAVADRERAASCSEEESDACVAAIVHGPCPKLGDVSTGDMPLDPRDLPSPCPRCSPLGPELRDAGSDVR